MNHPIHAAMRLHRSMIVAALSMFAGACAHKAASVAAAPVAAPAAAPAAAPKPILEFKVVKGAAVAPGSPRPAYPDSLRRAGVEGEVLTQFVVDQEGKPLAGSMKVLKPADAAFVQAVRDVFPSLRFTAPEVDGNRVRQLVQVPFVFALRRPPAPAQATPPDTSWKRGNGILKLDAVVILPRAP